jgi:hypothetical protein
MPNANRRCFAAGRLVALAIVALCLATPASAQFGGLKKKLKEKTATTAVEKAAGDAGAEAPSAPTGSDGSTVVLTAEAVDRLVAGLKAGQARRLAATKEDTPYGGYTRAQSAYETAKAKCEAGTQAGVQRMASNEKTSAKYTALMDKMIAAQTKQDTLRVAIYQDSMLAMIDPSCTVHQPARPDNYYDMQREVDRSAEAEILKTAGLTATEYGQTNDRIIAILAGDPPPPDASPSEKAAVTAKGPELKSLMGIRDPHEGRVGKAAPAAAPAPAAAADTAPPAPAVPTGMTAMNDCMVQNAQKHEAEIQALGKRGEAARKAGNDALMMAIADSVNRIMMAGCSMGQK